MQIEVLGITGDTVASLSLEPRSTVAQLRAKVAERLGTVSDSVQLLFGKSILRDGDGELSSGTWLEDGSTVTAMRLPRRSSLADFFMYSQGYDEGFMAEVRVSSGTSADYELLLERAKAGTQESLGLRHYFLPMADNWGQELLTPMAAHAGPWVTAEHYQVVAKCIEYRQSPDFDDVATGVTPLPCEDHVVRGFEVVPGWLRVTVYANKVRCDPCYGNGKACTECKGFGFRQGIREVSEVEPGEVEESEVKSSVWVNHLMSWGPCYALEKGPLPSESGWPLQSKEVLQLLSGSGTLSTYTFNAGRGQIRTAFDGEHIFESFFRQWAA